MISCRDAKHYILLSSNCKVYTYKFHDAFIGSFMGVLFANIDIYVHLLAVFPSGSGVGAGAPGADQGPGSKEEPWDRTALVEPPEGGRTPPPHSFELG